MGDINPAWEKAKFMCCTILSRPGPGAWAIDSSNRLTPRHALLKNLESVERVAGLQEQGSMWDLDGREVTFCFDR